MKTVLITGAAKGIGFAVARALVRQGCHVMVTTRDAAAGEKAAEALRSEPGGRVDFVPLDVTHADSLHAAAHTVAGLTTHLDVLINNAAIIVEGDDSILDINPALVSKTLATNTLGPLAVTQTFLPLLHKSLAPRIVNVSSGGGQLEDGMDTWAPAYCLSKTALNGLTSILAAALPVFAVNSVCPGWVRTDMGGANAPRSVEEGAAGIVWLAMEAPQSLTGKFLRDREVIAW